MGIYECYQDIQEKAQTEKIKNKQFFATFIKAGSYLQQLAGVFICIYKKLHTMDFGQDCAHVLLKFTWSPLHRILTGNFFILHA